MFLSEFMCFAKITVKRVIQYVIIGVICCPILLLLPLNWENRMILLFTLSAFFAFDGTIIEKISMNTIAESTWCALSLLSEIVFGRLVSFLVSSEMSQVILLDLINLIIFSCVIRLLANTTFFDQDMIKKRVTSAKQQFGMIILAIEGDIVLFIADIIYEQNITFIINAAVSGFFLCLAGLYLICFALSLDNSMAKEYYKVINKGLEARIKSQYQYYQKLEQITRETRAIKHDMKNHLIVLRGLTEKGEKEEVIQYLDSIQSKMDNVSVVVQTGNSIVDSIVNEKLEIATLKGINMKVDMALEREINVSAMDLCVMVANSLDNAIEACDKIQQGGQKKILIYGRCHRGYLSFIISNSVAKNVYINDNSIVTSKADKLNHGYGLQNIKNSVKRNNGTLKIECVDDVFSLYIDIQQI